MLHNFGVSFIYHRIFAISPQRGKRLIQLQSRGGKRRWNWRGWKFLIDGRLSMMVDQLEMIYVSENRYNFIGHFKFTPDTLDRKNLSHLSLLCHYLGLIKIVYKFWSFEIAWGKLTCITLGKLTCLRFLNLAWHFDYLLPLIFDYFRICLLDRNECSYFTGFFSKNDNIFKFFSLSQKLSEAWNFLKFYPFLSPCFLSYPVPYSI